MRLQPLRSLLSNKPSASEALRARDDPSASIAAVVGVLGAALYNPVWTSAVLTSADFALSLTGFLLLVVWKAPPWIVVVLMAASAILLQLSA